MTGLSQEPGKRLRLINTLFDTQPLVVHAHGHHINQVHWKPIRQKFFSLPATKHGLVQDLTVITCNNGAEAMGLFERSLDHLGIPYLVGGQGVSPWVNSRDKPASILRLLEIIDTTYALYADSRDALALGPIDELLERFKTFFDAQLVFGADRMHWPPLSRFKRFEKSMAREQPGDFHYLNGGMWIGKTDFCRHFFARAAAMPGVAEAPESEQGVLRQLFLEHPNGITIDYSCQLFQNIGFVVSPIFRLDVIDTKAT